MPLVQRVLRLYPENTIVWVHMGLSRELVDMNAAQHIQTVTSLLDRYPKLMVDISWRVIDDAYFSQTDKRAHYVSFLNDYSERILPGTDFLASRDKDIDVYRTELYVTSQILRDLLGLIDSSNSTTGPRPWILRRTRSHTIMKPTFGTTRWRISCVSAATCSERLRARSACG